MGSFNLFSGQSPADGRTEPDRLRAAIGALDADVLALQEVDRGLPRSGRIDQAALAAQALAAEQLRYRITILGTPGEAGWQPAGNAPQAESSEQPGYGIALISRLPVSGWHELRLVRGRGHYPLFWAGQPPSVRWVADEPRAAVAAQLTRPRLTVACTHLSFVPGVNLLQLAQVIRWLSRLPPPRILLGDLNLPAPLPSWLTGWTQLAAGASFPSSTPRLQLDHALASRLPDGSRWQGRVLEQLPVSDHRAVLVDLRLGS